MQVRVDPTALSETCTAQRLLHREAACVRGMRTAAPTSFATQAGVTRLTSDLVQPRHGV